MRSPDDAPLSPALKMRRLLRGFSTLAVASLLEAGEAELAREQFAAAKQLFAQAVTEAGSDAQQLMRGHNRLGFTLAALGEMLEARSSFEQCEALARRSCDATQLSLALVNVAGVELHLGAVERSVLLVTEAVELREKVLGAGAAETIDALLDLGRSLMVAGRLEEAAAKTEDALQRLEEGKTVAADVHNHLRQSLLALQIELLTRLQLPMKEGSVTELLVLAGNDEHVLRLVATYYAARKMQQETIAVLQKLPESESTLEQLGMLLMAGGRHAEAATSLTRAVELAENAHGKVSDKLIKPLWLLAQSHANDKPHDAQRLLLRVLALLRARKDGKDFQAHVTRSLAGVSVKQNLPNQALYYLRSAVALAEESGDAKLRDELKVELDTFQKKRKD